MVLNQGVLPWGSPHDLQGSPDDSEVTKTLKTFLMGEKSRLCEASSAHFCMNVNNEVKRVSTGAYKQTPSRIAYKLAKATWKNYSIQ